MKRIKLQTKIKTTVKIAPVVKYAAVSGSLGVVVLIIFLMIRNMTSTVVLKANSEINLQGFEWKKPLVLNTMGYQQADLVNYVCLLHFEDSDFILASNGGKIYKPDASDIEFIDANNNRLKHKIKNYNPVTGEISVWVLMDTLKSQVPNSIQVFYGNKNPISIIDTIWDDTYLAVWPFDNLYDNYSLFQYNQQNNNPGFIAGMSDYSIKFNGVDQYIHLAKNNNLTLGSEGTLSTWIYLNSYSDYAGIIHKGDKKNFSDEEYSLQLWNDGRILFALFDNNTSVKLFSSPVEIQKWYYVVASWDLNGMQIYIDGNLDKQTTQTLTTPNKSGGLNIGAQLNQNYDAAVHNFPFDGYMDETVILKSRVSSDWIKVTHALTTQPESIITLGGNIANINAMPVELIDFKAVTSLKNTVLVSWYTLTESNNKEFVLHRSADGVNYSKIASLEGHGTVNEANYYSFEDGSMMHGNNYYKLTQIDYDGKTKVYGPVSIDFSSDINLEITAVYPNPFNSEINLKINSGNDTEVSVVLFDNSTKEIFRKTYKIEKGQNNVSIDELSLIKPGYYFISVTEGINRIFNQAIIKS